MKKLGAVVEKIRGQIKYITSVERENIGTLIV